ncbi:MAG: RNA methyltransferase [Bacteroidales bacterium]|nr:RNA methyltransferase [Bacteroidales bacterium]
MLTKNQIKHISSLKIGKYRKESGEFVAEGSKVVEELLASKIEVLGVYVTKNWVAKNRSFNFAFAPEEVSESTMERMSQLTQPPGILAHARIPASKALPKRKFGRLSLALDGINDPGNLGTIIRTAEWFGVNDIFCSPDTVEAFHPKVVQSAMGSLFRMNTHEIALDHLLQDAIGQKVTIYSALMDGQNLYSCKLKAEPVMVVIGSESHGIRHYLTPFLGQAITIPAFNRSRPESLNASIATALILAELNRQFNS